MAARVQKNSSVEGTGVECKKITITTEPVSVTIKYVMLKSHRSKETIYQAIMKQELNWMAPEEVAHKLIVKDAKLSAYIKKCEEADMRKIERKAKKAKKQK